MNFIIFDLEATCWAQQSPSLVQETIEIGAVLINPYGEVEDHFSRFVRPKINPMLSGYCQSLTGISQIDVNRGRPFPEVIQDFQDWIGVDEEDYLLCSWGGFDKRLLRQDCALHRLEPDWVDKHINLKAQYSEFRKLRRPIGLKAAVEREGFEFTGQHHRGIDDAENLAKLFVKFLDEWQY